jgi:hypothetical protein
MKPQRSKAVIVKHCDRTRSELHSVAIVLWSVISQANPSRFGVNEYWPTVVGRVNRDRDTRRHGSRTDRMKNAGSGNWNTKNRLSPTRVRTIAFNSNHTLATVQHQFDLIDR